MHSDDERPLAEDEQIPRKGFLASMPKRTFSRVLVLLAALAGIIYLRQRTGAIASCMSDAFRLAPPEQRSALPVKVRIEFPAKASEKAPP
jgi:uncharacterized membrane protein